MIATTQVVYLNQEEIAMKIHAEINTPEFRFIVVEAAGSNGGRKFGNFVNLRTVKLPAGLATSRRAHFLIDRARAEMETGRTDAALTHLVEARRAAPEQTRYHPGARETISGLVHIARRTPDTLSQMATWVGL